MSNFDFKGMLSMNAAQNDGDFALNIHCTVEARTRQRAKILVCVSFEFFTSRREETKG
jgi:hypothetical protein